MNLKKLTLCGFLGYFSHRFWIPNLNKPIVKFWETDESYGFQDTRGNIFLKKDNASFERILSTEIPFLNYFKKYSNYYLFQYEKQLEDLKHTCFVDLRSNTWKDFEWTNTSSLEFIKDGNFFRLDYFGNMFVYSTETKKTYYNNLDFGKYEFLRAIDHQEDYFYVLNNMNVFRIYRYFDKNFETLCVYENKMNHYKLTKKMLISPTEKYKHVLFLYTDNTIEIFSYRDDTIVALSSITLPCTIVDVAFQKDFLVVAGIHSLHLYTFAGNEFEKIREKTYHDLPYFTEIFWYGKVLYFNNQDHLVTIQVDSSKYNSTIYPIIASNNTKPNQ